MLIYLPEWYNISKNKLPELKIRIPRKIYFSCNSVNTYNINTEKNHSLYKQQLYGNHRNTYDFHNRLENILINTIIIIINY